jgi:hypothetical protein
MTSRGVPITKSNGCFVAWMQRCQRQWVSGSSCGALASTFGDSWGMLGVSFALLAALGVLLGPLGAPLGSRGTLCRGRVGLLGWIWVHVGAAGAAQKRSDMRNCYKIQR